MELFATLGIAPAPRTPPGEEPAPALSPSQLAAARTAAAAYSRVYGVDMGRVLAAIGHVESSGNNPDAPANVVPGVEDSRGALQINTLVHGTAAAPTGPAAGPTIDARLEAQARAAGEVVKEARATAAEIVRRTGAPFVEAFNLAWQFSPARALAIAGNSAWTPSAIAARIDMLRARISGAAWRARNAVVRAVWSALEVETGLAIGGLVLLLLVAIAIAGTPERRARTARIAAAGARALA